MLFLPICKEQPLKTYMCCIEHFLFWLTNAPFLPSTLCTLSSTVDQFLPSLKIIKEPLAWLSSIWLRCQTDSHNVRYQMPPDSGFQLFIRFLKEKTPKNHLVWSWKAFSFLHCFQFLSRIHSIVCLLKTLAEFYFHFLLILCIICGKYIFDVQFEKCEKVFKCKCTC